LCDYPRSFLQEKSRREKRQIDILLTEEVAERRQVAVQQRLTTGQYDLPNPELSQRETMPFEIGSFDLLILFTLPDVAHHAAAVASAMHIKDQDRKGLDMRVERHRQVLSPGFSE
jgi:hypothetical protein